MSAPAFSISDYKRDHWASLDKPYWSIFLVVFLIEMVVLIYLQSLPVREMTHEETLAFQRRVFNVLAPPEIQPVEDAFPGEDVADGSGEEDEGEEAVEEAPEAPIEQQQETVVSRQQRRSQQEAARTERQAAAQQAAAQTGLFAAVGGDFASGGAEGLVDTDVRSSGAVNVDQVGSIHTGGQGEAIREIRGGLAAGEGDGSGVDVDFSSMSASELRQLASVGGVSVGEIFGDNSSGAGTATARSERSILARLVELQKGVQTCFERNKRRKRDLAGSIKLYWTILANGTVDRISIEGSWNDAALGGRIETCIKRKVETWQFEEISASAGDFPTGTRFIFE
jgi:hypothetical protein